MSFHMRFRRASPLSPLSSVLPTHAMHDPGRPRIELLWLLFEKGCVGIENQKATM